MVKPELKYFATELAHSATSLKKTGHKTMNTTTHFLSCDWGTTAFRLRLVAAAGFEIVAESGSKQGIAAVHKEWGSSGKSEGKRTAFYQAIILEHISKVAAEHSALLKGAPLIISGMASSSIGMTELPYKKLPFRLDGSDLATRLLPATQSFPYPTLVISGVAAEDDVMRGEETQMVGGVQPLNGAEVQLMIHPGTHCKHILARGGEVVSFKTYMTGELFSLLSTQSILAASVVKGGSFSMHRGHFESGLTDAAGRQLLHTLFRVRTGDLFKRRTREEAFYYLSGLLIGSELSDFPGDFAGHIILAGEETLVAQYRAALELLGIAARAASVSIQSAELITIAGQYKVYERHQQP